MNIEKIRRVVEVLEEGTPDEAMSIIMGTLEQSIRMFYPEDQWRAISEHLLAMLSAKLIPATN